MHACPAPLSSVVPLADRAATERLGAHLAALAQPADAVLLAGPLGAGKTVLARAFLRAAAADPTLVVPSPSYTLVQSYQTRLGPVHHFDLWRLADDATFAGHPALAELGWDEAIADIVIVEWPDRLGPLAPRQALRISLAILADATRVATLAGWPGRLARLP